MSVQATTELPHCAPRKKLFCIEVSDELVGWPHYRVHILYGCRYCWTLTRSVWMQPLPEVCCLYSDGLKLVDKSVRNVSECNFMTTSLYHIEIKLQTCVWSKIRLQFSVVSCTLIWWTCQQTSARWHIEHTGKISAFICRHIDDVAPPPWKKNQIQSIIYYIISQISKSVTSPLHWSPLSTPHNGIHSTTTGSKWNYLIDL